MLGSKQVILPAVSLTPRYHPRKRNRESAECQERKIRIEGRMVHDMYLFEVKKPEESIESSPHDEERILRVSNHAACEDWRSLSSLETSGRYVLLGTR